MAKKPISDREQTRLDTVEKLKLAYDRLNVLEREAREIKKAIRETLAMHLKAPKPETPTNTPPTEANHDAENHRSKAPTGGG